MSTAHITTSRLLALGDMLLLHTPRSTRTGQVRFVLAGMNVLYYSLFGDDGIGEDEWSVIMARNLLSGVPPCA